MGVQGRGARGVFSAGIICIMDFFLIQYVCLLSIQMPLTLMFFPHVLTECAFSS